MFLDIEMVRVVQITRTRYPLALLRGMGTLQTNWIDVDDWELPTNIIVFWACNEIDAGIPGLRNVGIADTVISDCHRLASRAASRRSSTPTRVAASRRCRFADSLRL